MNIDLNPNTEETNQTEQAVQPLSTSTINDPGTITQKDLEYAKLIAEVLRQSSQHNQDEKAQQEYEQAIMRDSKSFSKAGQATSTFKQQMEKEIANGYSVRYPYPPGLARKHGSFCNFGVNGYNVGFVAGEITQVPNSLLSFVDSKFGVNQSRSTSKGNVTAFDASTGLPDEQTTTEVNEVIQSITNTFHQ